MTAFVYGLLNMTVRIEYLRKTYRNWLDKGGMQLNHCIFRFHSRTTFSRTKILDYAEVFSG